MGGGSVEGKMRPAVIASIIVVACAPGPTIATQPASAPGPVTTPIVRTASTISGQPLRLPQPQAEIVAAVTAIPPGGRIPLHQHPWQRIVYVERGPIRVINRDTGETRDFQSGQAFAEAVSQWHEGVAPGPAGARLIVIDLVPPGATTVTLR